MYVLRFQPVSTDADFVISLALTDRNTGADYDASGDEITIEIAERPRGSRVLQATKANGKITIADGWARCRFTQSEISQLHPGTYHIGCVMQNDQGGKTQPFRGTVPFIDGGIQ